MIVYKDTKVAITRSDMPFENWTEDDVYVVKDGTELTNKINKNSPYFDFIINGDGNLMDVTPTERPVSSHTPTELELLKQRVVKQDTILEEILFVIIPDMMGGGI